MVSMEQNLEVLCWNVRGLNNPAKRSAVREFVVSVGVSIVCLLESKLDIVDRYILAQCVGPEFDAFVHLPAQETRGGIIVAWKTLVVTIDQVVIDTYGITGRGNLLNGNQCWIIVVYGPQGDELKLQFLEELRARRVQCQGQWLLIGVFNMILRASEKSNDNLNRNMMNQFRGFVDELELKEVYMHGHRFTWSNEREVPTFTKIDRALVSSDWDEIFPDCLLQALSTSVSDHAPLHLAMGAPFFVKRRFRFELYWTKLEEFDDAIRAGWVCDPAIVDPFKWLDALFRNMAAYLQSWGQKKTGNIKIQIAIANMVIRKLDIA